jgi:hypothetical protein
MRMQRSLAGVWQFQLDPEGTLNIETLTPDREIPVPMPWQAAFPDLQQYSGYAWYRTTLTLDDDWLGGTLLLTFGAVDYWCQIFINRQLVCEHEGGYMPFTAQIDPYVQGGKNEIAVRVFDPAQPGITFPRWPQKVQHKDAPKPPFDADFVPHGKQEWYINAGGIWQDVTLTRVPAVHIDTVRLTPDIHSGRVQVAIELSGETNRLTSGSLHVQIEDQEASIPLKNGLNRYVKTLTIKQPHLWSPDTPNLYTAAVRLDSGDIQDETQTRFGFREIRTQDGKLLLNGEPLFLLSALDQDLYPDTIYTVPSEEFLRDQFKKAKQLGLNNLRCHIKPPDPRYLDLADEMGLLVWAEVPSWRTFHVKTTVHPNMIELDDLVKARVRSTLQEMIQRDFNHPSIIIWTIVNEDWGTSLPLSDADRAWVADMYDLCKTLDPTRLAVDNSPCPSGWGPNVHVKSDIDDFHIYTNIPDQAESWVQFLEQFNLHPLWTYTSEGQAKRTGKEPMILSEFGNWGMPSMRNLTAKTGQEPHWFNIGPWWSPWDGEPGWPGGVVERFKALGLDQIWPDYEAFSTATQWHQFQALKFEIETMRRLAHLAGYVITEFSDIYWESNGLLDFNRAPKVFIDQFALINSPDVVIPQMNSYAYWDDQNAFVRLFGSHFSAADWSGGKLHWSLGSESGSIDVDGVQRGLVRDFGLQQWKLPSVDQTQTLRLDLSLTDGSGRELARNFANVLLMPASARTATITGEIAVITRREQKRLAVPYNSEPDLADLTTAGSSVSTPETTYASENDATIMPRRHQGFAGVVQSLGYNVNRALTADTRLIITDYPNVETLKWVRDGGDMLFLSNGPSAFFWRHGRGGTYGGSWISSFSWLRPGIYRRLTVDNPVTMPFVSAMPIATILGLPVTDRGAQQDFLAGQVAGWVRHPAVHTVQFRYGKGRVIMTTFNLRDSLQDQPPDPVAIAMLHDLIEHLVSDACDPVIKANF